MAAAQPVRITIQPGLVTTPGGVAPATASLHRRAPTVIALWISALGVVACATVAGTFAFEPVTATQPLRITIQPAFVATPGGVTPATAPLHRRAPFIVTPRITALGIVARACLTVAVAFEPVAAAQPVRITIHPAFFTASGGVAPATARLHRHAPFAIAH